MCQIFDLYCVCHLNQVQALDEVIRERIKVANAKQKEAYDTKQQKRVKKFTFAEGDRVLEGVHDMITWTQTVSGFVRFIHCLQQFYYS